MFSLIDLQMETLEGSLVWVSAAKKYTPWYNLKSSNGIFHKSNFSFNGRQQLKRSEIYIVAP